MKIDNFEISQLLTKYLQETISPEEELRLMELLDQEEYHNLLDKFKDPKATLNGLEFMNSVEVDTAWKKISSFTNENKINYFKFFRYAAVFVLIAGALVFFRPMQESISDENQAFELPSDVVLLTLPNGTVLPLGEDATRLLAERHINASADSNSLTYTTDFNENIGTTGSHQLVVPSQHIFQVNLSDGSKVWLNAGSTLTYPGSFNTDERRVILDGEAYFDVFHDAKTSFIVETSQGEIEVLGTSFNIDSYDQTTTTTLIDGSVRVRYANQSLTLKPGESAQANKDILKEIHLEVDKITPWKDGYFYFDREALRTVLEEVCRWYKLQLDQSGPEIDTLEFSGKIKRNTDLSDMLLIIEDVSGATLKLNGNTLEVTRRKLFINPE